MKTAVLRSILIILMASTVTPVVSGQESEPTTTHKSALRIPQRPRHPTSEINKESSSFVPDPDSLDPLPLKNESLKEDDEPVLEDIKSVLDQPVPENLKPKKIEKQTAEVKPAAKPKKAVVRAKVKKKPQAKVKKIQPVVDHQSEPPVQPKKQPETVKVARVKNKKSKPTVSALSSGGHANKVVAPAWSGPLRREDDPDLNIEFQFYNIFQRYNSTPTSPEAWGRAVDVKNMQTYAIQKGDTLYTLSEALFGDSQFWPKIWALNRNDITNPHFIRPGMVIQFIPGTATQAPALNLAAVESSTPTTQQSTAATDEVVAEFKPDVDPVNGKDYSRQDTEFQKLTFDSHGPKKKNFKIPDSFPGYKVPDMRDRNTTQMQLKPRRDLPDPQVPNPFYLSADEVTADLKVESENADDLFCRAEQYVPKVTLLNPTAPQGQYALLVAETEMLGLLEKTYLYRRIGSAVLDADGALRVKDCHSLINTDIVIVNESKLNQLTAPVESKSQDKTLIVAGLDAYKQNYIYRSQYVLVDVSRLGQVQTGRELNIFSKASGQKPTGRLRLLNQQGTLAVAYVIESQDVIQVGDFISE